MGFHVVSISSDEWNIVVYDNDCFKTDKSVAIDTELVWKALVNLFLSEWAFIQ